MSARIFTHDVNRLKRMLMQTKLIREFNSKRFILTVRDMDDILTYWTISHMRHDGKLLKEIAEECGFSITTVVNRSRNGAYTLSRIIVPLIRRFDGNMLLVAEAIAPIFEKSITECNYFIKNFIDDYQHDSGSSVSIATRVKNMI